MKKRNRQFLPYGAALVLGTVVTSCGVIHKDLGSEGVVNEELVMRDPVEQVVFESKKQDKPKPIEEKKSTEENKVEFKVPREIPARVKSTEKSRVNSLKMPTPSGSKKIALTPNDKVFFVGDSLMQGVAPFVNQTLRNNYGIQGIDLSKQSSGLRNLQFYNWPKVIEDTFVQNPDIKLMVVYLGPNDPWGFSNMAFKSSSWEVAYRQRISQIIKTAQSHGARVLWLGVPDMKKQDLQEGMVYLNSLYQSEVTRHGEIYQPTREILGSKGKEFASSVQKDGKTIQVRAGDGVHFTVAGQKFVADAVLSYIQVAKK